jgi:hypothetical protein
MTSPIKFRITHVNHQQITREFGFQNIQSCRHGARKLQIGDQDPLFDLTAVRQSAASLAKAGHRVDLAVIPDHGHWLYDVGPVLAANAWAFFTRPD